MNTSPFEASPAELVSSIETHIDSVFASLASDFLTLPKGAGFLPYPDFEAGYESLKRCTQNFSNFTPEHVLRCVEATGVSLIVLRTMLGFTAPELAHIAKMESGEDVSQGFARSLEGKIRSSPRSSIRLSPSSRPRLSAIVSAACQLLSTVPPPVSSDRIHRLDKADTAEGLVSLQSMASLGVPYPVVLYERFLGRPFAGHRDSISELVGDAMEGPIETLLTDGGISFRKTRRAEKIKGFDQAPDFIIPNEFNPAAVIEAKICEDDGTARDKVTRIQHLAEISKSRVAENGKGFEVIACISGRGFGVRREDMRKLLLATNGKVFTLRTLDKLIENTSLRSFRSR